MTLLRRLLGGGAVTDEARWVVLDVEASLLDAARDNLLVAVAESGARFGISSLDLSSGRFQVLEVDGEEALAAMTEYQPHMVLLDATPAGRDGFQICEAMRANPDWAGVKIIMLSAKARDIDRQKGFAAGADDYVAKPFSPRELLARLRAVVRRAAPAAVADRLTAGGIEVDVGGREAFVDGAALELTALELDLLVALVRRAGRVVPRAALLELAGRGDVTVGERTIDVHVSRLRKKLGAAAPQLKTVRGIGYTLARARDEGP